MENKDNLFNKDRINKRIVKLSIEIKNNTHSEEELLKVFNFVARYCKVVSFVDPHKCLESEDYRQILFEIYLVSLKSLDFESFINPIGIFYRLFIQKIKRQNKAKNRYKNYGELSTFEEEELKCIEEPFDSDVDMTDSYKKIYKDLFVELSKINHNTARVFILKIAFPSMSRTIMAQIIGLKRRSGLSRIHRVINATAHRKLFKEDFF